MQNCLGWDANSMNANDFDLDASVFMLHSENKIISDSQFIFYGQLLYPCRSIEYTGDNLTGEGDGDDESIKVNLDEVPAEVDKIVIGVTIHETASKYWSSFKCFFAFNR